jgi:hypothetical protein
VHNEKAISHGCLNESSILFGGHFPRFDGEGRGHISSGSGRFEIRSSNFIGSPRQLFSFVAGSFVAGGW